MNVQPVAKRAKFCTDVNEVSVERVLKFSTTHQLLSFSLATNVPGVPGEYFACRQGDTDSEVKALVDQFVSQLLSISEQSFKHLQNVYSDILLELNQTLAVESA